MRRFGKLIFVACVLVHGGLSSFSYAFCAGVSMVALDSHWTELPRSLFVMCYTDLVCSLPLMPLTRLVFARLGPGLPESHAVYWVLVLTNSILAISIIYLAIRLVRRLLSHQAPMAHEQT